MDGGRDEAGRESVTQMSPVPRVVRNDWSTVAVPDLVGWRPSCTVSVVIPAFGGQGELDLVLAALSAQTYPADLLEVVVVDDGSDPPLALTEIRPRHTTLLRASDGWGKANALRIGVAHSSGDILHLLDADMVVYPEHVAAMVRWQHAVPYAVTLGHKRFVDEAVVGPWPGPAAVVDAWSRGAAGDLFGGEQGEPHDYVERYTAQTDQLRTADHLVFRIHVGATVTLRRELYDAAGGPDPQLRFGNDTELGYRLAQAGAVFVPEPRAQGWHLGPSHVMRSQDQIARYRLAFLADRVPYPRNWRKVGGTAWTVPLVEVVVTTGDGPAEQPLERVRTAVDSVLRGTERDVRVSLVGPWEGIETGRMPALTDPRREPRLVAATYRGEPRVRLVTRAPDSAFPSPYLLELPATYGLLPDGLARLVDLADRDQVGVVRVTAPGNGPDVTLWRTAALARARWVRDDGEPLLDAVASVHGRRDVTAAAAGVVDLTRFAPGELTGGITDITGRGRLRGGVVPSMVEVEGVRSLARATVVVAKLGLRRSRSWLRGLRRRLA
jgi:glycosyltransferase involved in cell wall biosynthesis